MTGNLQPVYWSEVHPLIIKKPANDNRWFPPPPTPANQNRLNSAVYTARTILSVARVFGRVYPVANAVLTGLEILKYLNEQQFIPGEDEVKPVSSGSPWYKLRDCNPPPRPAGSRDGWEGYSAEYCAVASGSPNEMSHIPESWRCDLHLGYIRFYIGGERFWTETTWQRDVADSAISWDYGSKTVSLPVYNTELGQAQYLCPQLFPATQGVFPVAPGFHGASVAGKLRLKVAVDDEASSKRYKLNEPNLVQVQQKKIGPDIVLAGPPVENYNPYYQFKVEPLPNVYEVKTQLRSSDGCLYRLVRLSSGAVENSTELVEAVDAIYKQLPAHLRAPYRAGERIGYFEKMELIWKYRDQVNWSNAIADVITGSGSDRFYGRIIGKGYKNLTKYGSGVDGSSKPYYKGSYTRDVPGGRVQAFGLMRIL